MRNEAILRGALLGLVALGLTAAQGSALAAKGENEKCAGIAKAGKNDCATAKHSCMGKAAKDGEADEWVYVPKGACEKIVGGKLVAK